MNDMAKARALIIDFGSQFTRLIARRLRESGIYCEIHPCTAIDDAFLNDFAPRAIILSGGPGSLRDHDAPRLHPAILTHGAPLLGICYGQQAMMATCGGAIETGIDREFGRAMLRPVQDSPLLDGWFADGAEEQVWMSHGDRVASLPDGFVAIAASDGAPFAVVADESRHLYGVQFHPEVVHTPNGALLLRNFTHGIAGMRGDWNMSSFRASAIGQW